jgi:hypothetical protein
MITQSVFLEFLQKLSTKNVKFSLTCHVKHINDVTFYLVNVTN